LRNWTVCTPFFSSRLVCSSREPGARTSNDRRGEKGVGSRIRMQIIRIRLPTPFSRPPCQPGALRGTTAYPHCGTVSRPPMPQRGHAYCRETTGISLAVRHSPCGRLDKRSKIPHACPGVGTLAPHLATTSLGEFHFGLPSQDISSAGLS
jgi:hypothetical protein